MSLPIRTYQHLLHALGNYLPGDQILLPMEIVEDLLEDFNKTSYELEEAEYRIRDLRHERDY